MTSILVYCDATPHSTPIGPLIIGSDPQLPDDIVVLAEFTRDDMDATDGWHAVPFSARRDGQFGDAHRMTEQLIAADGSVVGLWGMDLPRQTAEIARARAVAGRDDLTALGRRYQLRCPACGYEVRRNGDKLATQFEALAAQNIAAVSLAGLNGGR